MIRRIFAAAALALIATNVVYAQSKPFGIASAAASGTNYPMVEDIRAVCSKPGAEISNLETNGTLDNIALVYGDPRAQFAIAQLDGLKYQQGIDPKMMDRIQVVFPFFSTEIHLVTRDGSQITDLSQLAGKRVIEGPEGGGTWVTVQVIKSLTGIKWQGFYAGPSEGMKAVVAGQADAMFIVAGKPVKVIQDTPQARLVSLKHPKLDEFSLYTRAIIPGGTYAGIKQTINTYKIDNAMITYAFKNERQAEISGLVTCISRNIDRLQSGATNPLTGKPFHPKWRDVDPLDINRISWPVHPAAKAAINREARK